MENILKDSPRSDRLQVTSGGYLVCPKCKRNRHLLKLDATTSAQHLRLYCRDCKSEITVNIEQGQCFESRSR